MNATYIRDANCQVCMEMYPDLIGEECKKCESMRTETVKILEFCKGLFGASAIVLFKDGTLQTIPIHKLKVQGGGLTDDSIYLSPHARKIQ